MDQKTKILYILLTLITAAISFFLGRFSAISVDSTKEITIISSSKIRNKIEQENNTEIQIRASSRGSKYYFPWCESSFAEENTIYFNSPQEAEKAGYEKATNCIEKTP